MLAAIPPWRCEAKIRLARVGYDRVAGQLADPAAPRPDRAVDTSSRLTIGRLPNCAARSRIQLVDVRSPVETTEGVLPGAREIPLTMLTDSLAGLDPLAPVVVYCETGYRSQVAASVLVSRGFADVSDLLGGYRAWHAAGRGECWCAVVALATTTTPSSDD